MKNDHQNLAKLLRSDAEKIRETEELDPRLHQDTMREIRRIESGRSRDQGFSWSSFKISATAAIAVIAFIFVLRQGQTPVESVVDSAPKIVATQPPAPGSAQAYREALFEGEDELLAMLDRDALVILPRSSAVFTSDR